MHFFAEGYGHIFFPPVFSWVVFDFRPQSSNWFLLPFCPDVPWYRWRRLTERYRQTPGESKRGCSSLSSLFSAFWQSPRTAESFWISAIMFSLCNPQHGRGGGGNRSFYVCYIISAFLSPSLSTPDVPHLPSKALPGCTINSCFAAWHNKDYLHGDSSIAAERRVALSEF